MTRLAALITLLAIGSAHAESDLPEDAPQVVRIEYGELTLPSDGDEHPAIIHVASGVYLNHIASVSVAAHMEAIEAENKSLKTSLANVPSGGPSWLLLVSAIGLTLAGGFALGVALHSKQ